MIRLSMMFIVTNKKSVSASVFDRQFKLSLRQLPGRLNNIAVTLYKLPKAFMTAICQAIFFLCNKKGLIDLIWLQQV